MFAVKKKKIMVIHGPNLNLLGTREPEIYGTDTLKSIDREIRRHAASKGIGTISYQSNHEGRIIDFLHNNRCGMDGMIINPAALTHYSIALRDAVAALNIPAVEVHLSDLSKREAFRQHSVLKGVCIAQITGLGKAGYLKAVDVLVDHI